MSNETTSNNRLGILTISDSGFTEKLDDVSGDQIETLAQKAGFIKHLRAIVPDEEIKWSGPPGVIELSSASEIQLMY